jgi:cobaltochelatase CobS
MSRAEMAQAWKTLTGTDHPTGLRADLIRDLQARERLQGLPAAPSPAPSPDRGEFDRAQDGRIAALEAAGSTQAKAVTAVLDRIRDLNTKFEDLTTAQDALLRTVADKLGPSGVIERVAAAAQAAADAALAHGRAIAALESRPAADPAQVAAEISTVVRTMLGPVIAQAKAEGREDEVRTALSRGDWRPVDEVFPYDAAAPLTGTVECWDHPEAPAIDQGFVWTAAHLRAMQCAEHEGLLVWLCGPKGTGKTTIAQQYAARTGRPFTRINFFRHSSSEDYLGAGALSEGSTTWEPGDFLRAYTTPGSLILLDELSTAHPGVLSHLNGLLEPNARVSLGGRVWTRAAGVMIVAADNTNGSGDITGRYSGTQAANSATVDRFGLMVRVDYLDPATEAEALSNGARCSRSLAEHIVEAFGAIRAKVDDGDVVDPPSLRQAIAFAKASRWMPVAEAWETAIVARQPVESAVALRAVFASHIDQSKFGV